MKLHQSAWALLPWTKIRPGLPISPQVSSSMFAPRTGTRVRSGAWARAALNQAGLSGSAPANRASGEATSGRGQRPGIGAPDRLVVVQAFVGHIDP